MSDEQTTSGTSVNPAATAHAPRQGVPVMDVVPPPNPASSAAQPSVVAAPAEQSDMQISDEIAEQIAADATMPPAAEPSPIAAPPVLATPPPDDEAPAPGAGDSPSELIQAEIKHDAAQPVAATVRAPKVANPVRTAVIATIIVTVLLAGLAVFAYLSTQS